MNKLNFPIFVLLFSLSTSSFSSETFGTYLCEKKYDQKLRQYYCDLKIKKVIFSVGMDNFYRQDKSQYFDFSRNYFNSELEKIKNEVGYFKFDIVDKSLGNKFVPSKNEVFIHIHFYEPDFTNNILMSYAIISIDGKIEISNGKFSLSGRQSFEKEFEKNLKKSVSGMLFYLYSKEGAE